MARLPRIFSGTVQRCQRTWKVIRSFYKDSPLIFALVLATILLIVLLVFLFSSCVKRVIGARGTVVVDLVLVWLFARLVARVLMFPGSFKLFQRNTEATFRTEMSRQYAHYLRQLWTFLRHAARQSESMLRGVTADGVVRGCAVIETLTASFQLQQQHEVRLSKEQEIVHAAAQEVERWLASASVTKPGGFSRPMSGPSGGQGQAAGLWPLVDWLRQQAASAAMGSASPLHSLMSVELAGSREDAARSIEKIEQLLVILDELRYQKKSIFRNALRFFQVPTIGSLNQLRAELQMRYGGHRCWVPTRGGHRLDAMFIPCDGGPGAGEDEAEDAPLKNQGKSVPAFSGPTLIWCNPNAAYYETMVYQTTWLNFWLSRGISLFFFNYAGYGRSTGKPSPSRIAGDGESVIRFLKSKGITQIGVYGRSIGGIAACHLARRHPDVVQLLVADRTMSTLEGAARYMYGAWAASGLKVTAMMADNVDNFWEVRAYKLLVVDPKDTMILDLAALRTAVALRVVERMAPEERLTISEDMLLNLAEVWRFFALLFAICESDEDFGFEGSLGPESSRPARQPCFTRDEPRTDYRLKVGEGSGQAAGSQGGAGGGSERPMGTQWLEESAGLVRSAMIPFVDQVRSALDIVGEYLEGGGVTLNDVFADNPNSPCWALQSMLANLQVWGTLGDQREESDELGGEPQVSYHEVECFLRKDGDGDYFLPRATQQRLAELERMLAPETLTTYHRRLARARVGQVRREFRRRLTALQHALTHAGASVGDAQAGEQAERLLRTVLHHLGQVESFVSTLSRFFKSVDLAIPYNRQQGSPEGIQEPTPLSDSSDEKMQDAGPEGIKKGAVAPQPAIDHSTAGYIMHIDCGHNGLMDEVDLRQLSLHLRAARFGRAPPETS